MCWATSSPPFGEKKDTAFFISFGLFLPQAQLLRELQHRVAEEARHRQQLDLMKASGMEKLLEDVRQKDQHLQLLTEEAERASKLGRLQQKRTQTELRQVTPVGGSSHLKANQGAPARAGILLAFSLPLVSSTFVISRPTGKRKYFCPCWVMLRLRMVREDGLTASRPRILAPLEPMWETCFHLATISELGNPLENSNGNLEKQQALWKLL